MAKSHHRAEALAPPPDTQRLIFRPFQARANGVPTSAADQDCADLAALLADPELTRQITANGSSPARCLQTAADRIAWHNGTWQSRGFGVWALRLSGPALALPGAIARPQRVVGWCGFCEADEAGADPEILYGLGRDCRGHGLGGEAARAAIDWLFENTDARGVSAVISARLNPASVQVVERLGFAPSGRMDFHTFLSDPELAREVLDYEIWRLGAGVCDTPADLIFQAAFRAGQLTAEAGADPQETRAALRAAARARTDLPEKDAQARSDQAARAYEAGQGAVWMDCYHITRAAWRAGGEAQARPNG